MTTKWTSTTLSGSDAPPPQIPLGEKSGVLLLYGKNAFGDKIYSYLKLTLNNMQRLKGAIQSGQSFTPSDFGEVIAAGRGEPTDTIRAEIAAMHPVMDAQKPQKPKPEIPAGKKAWDEY